VRLRRKIIGHKLGKYNAKMDTALKDRTKHTQKALKNYDENIKRVIDEMYANMN
jgi:Ser/Thr protein kinase RdoA (MazF antagonist)